MHSRNGTPAMPSSPARQEVGQPPHRRLYRLLAEAKAEVHRVHQDSYDPIREMAQERPRIMALRIPGDELAPALGVDGPPVPRPREIVLGQVNPHRLVIDDAGVAVGADHDVLAAEVAVAEPLRGVRRCELSG